MPWLVDQQPSWGELSSQAQVHGGSLPSGLLQPRRNPLGEILGLIGQQAFNYLEQRQKEQRANELLATLDAKPAVAVDPSTVGTGQPSTSLSPAEAARNAALGYSSSYQTPQMGGTGELENRIAAIKMQKMIDESKPDLIKDEHGNWVDPRQASYDLSVRRLNQPDTGVQYVDTPYGRMTAHEWSVHPANPNAPRNPKEADTIEKIDKDLKSETGVDLGDWGTATKTENPDGSTSVTIPSSSGDKTATIPKDRLQYYIDRVASVRGTSSLDVSQKNLPKKQVASGQQAYQNTLGASTTTAPPAGTDATTANAQAAAERIRNSGLSPADQATRINEIRKRLEAAGYSNITL